MPSPKSLPSALLGLALACPAMAEEPKGMELGQVLISAAFAWIRRKLNG